MSIASDMVGVLVAAGLGTSGAGGTVLEGPMRDGATFGDALITVLPTGGTAEPTLGGTSAPDLTTSRVQVRIRSAKDAYGAGQATADAVQAALHKNHTAAYMAWLADPPIYFQQDDQGRHHWSVNVTVTTYA